MPLVRTGTMLVALFALAALCALAFGGKHSHAADPAAPAAIPSGAAVMTVAGGCFWCVEEAFEHLDGVASATSGYTGGALADPTYEQVSAGGTGHFEAVQIVYDPRKITYEKLLDVFWHNVDPTDAAGQFCDQGSPYKSAIFVHDEGQKAAAEASKRTIEQSGKPTAKVATEILPAGTFYPAEEYHQDYAEKNPIRYRFYRTGCGRDRRLHEVWGDAAGS
jgi:peptide-methionine (S)-S-oxide reductase